MTRFLTFLALLVGLSAQDSVKLQRTFKVGEVDTYQSRLSQTTEIGDVDFHFKTSQTVKSVSATGEAELEVELLELKTMINGAEMPAPTNNLDRKTTFKVDRNGVPSSAKEQGAFGFSFLNFAGMVGNQPLTVGKKSPIEIQDPKDPKGKVTGDVLLESIKDGEAKLISHLEIQTQASAKTLKLDMTSLVEVANGKLKKASGTGAVNVGTNVQPIRFSIERVK